MGTERRLLSGDIVTFARSYRGVINIAQFNPNSTKVSVAKLVGWIISERVLSADIIGDLSKGSTGFGQTCDVKVAPTRSARQFVHLAARQAVKFATDIQA